MYCSVHTVFSTYPAYIIKIRVLPGTCDGGIFTFEKSTGHFLRTAMQHPLAVDGTAPGITTDCAKMCADLGAECPAFAVDYAGQRCFKLDRNTQVG
jgi:hypothetical protein